MTVLVALAITTGGTARAGKHDAAWAAVGGLVVGAVAGAAISSASERTTVVYAPAPVAPPPPVVYAPAPAVVYVPAPVVVHRPVYAPRRVVVAAPPVCVLPPPPVYCPPSPCGPVVVHGGRPWRHHHVRPHFSVSVGW
ncbi:MAG: hypothetical protein IT580_09410 [Verrucomicrobiales bacterium]|nr:hypothetical protein [Verrucomicrobiales bacterium]